MSVTIQEAVRIALNALRNDELTLCSDCSKTKSYWRFGVALKSDPSGPIPGHPPICVDFNGEIKKIAGWTSARPSGEPGRSVDISEYLVSA